MVNARLRRRVVMPAFIWVNALWHIYCVHASLQELKNRRRHPTFSEGNEASGVAVVVPMLDEADQLDDFLDHWSRIMITAPEMQLCVVTTEREATEAPSGERTWDALQRNDLWNLFVAAARAHWIHYPVSNRTYGEQLRWALAELDRILDVSVTHFYISNADSRIAPAGVDEIVGLANERVACAQQSTVFLGNIDRLSWVAAGEALYQSRWTFEREIFRYTVGAGGIPWIPAGVARRWYQHAVGHGLLLAREYYRELGGLPEPKYGLEDAALGFKIRLSGGKVIPFSTLECGAAPSSLAELQRQRSTWVRGPLCSFEYGSGVAASYLALQGTYDGLKWSMGLPIKMAAMLFLPKSSRAWALAGLALGLFGPLARVLLALPSMDLDVEPVHRGHLVRAVSAYCLAPLSYWAGGFKGLVLLVADISRGSEWTQERTRERRLDD